MQAFLALLFLGFDGSSAAKCISLNSEPCIARPTLTDLNLMNCVTRHLWLVYKDVIEVIILMMIYLIKYVFQT